MRYDDISKLSNDEVKKIILTECKEFYDEFISYFVAPTYIDSLEKLYMNDHWSSSENEVMAFGDFYIVPVEYATKMINEIDPDGGYI